MKVLVTGGCGFIASHLVEALVARDCACHGDEVVVIDNLSSGSLVNLKGVSRDVMKLIVADCAFEKIVQPEVEKADLVFHLAATVGVKRVMEDPVETISNMHDASQTVIEACALYNKRLIITSSSEVYGASTKEAFSEDDDCIIGPTTKSRWCYAAAKLMDEFLALAYHKSQGLPVTVARLFNTIGPRQSGQYGMVVPTFVRQALADKPLTIYGDGEQQRAFTSVHDVVKCLLALAECDAAIGGVVNVGSENQIRIHQLASWIWGEVNGHDVTAVVGELVNPKDAYGEDFVDMRHRKPDVSKLKKLIGFVPETPLSEILKEIVEHERQLA